MARFRGVGFRRVRAVAVRKGDLRKMQGRKARCELSVANHVKSDDVGDSGSSIGVRSQRQ